MPHVTFKTYDDIQLWCHYTASDYDDINILSIYLPGDDYGTDLQPIIMESIIEQAFNAASQDYAEAHQEKMERLREDWNNPA